MPGQIIKSKLASVAGNIRERSLPVGLKGWQADAVMIPALAIVILLAHLAGLTSNGVTWDEVATVSSGNIYVQNLVDHNFSAFAWSFLMEHPPVGKYLYGLAMFGLDGGVWDSGTIYDTKLVSAILGTLTCVLVYLICRDFYGRGIGFSSALVLGLMPVVMAHTQIAALDSPLLFFFTLAMYLFMKLVATGRSVYLCLSALSTGLLLGTKFNGLLALPVMATFYFLHRRRQLSLRPAGSAPASLAERALEYVPAMKSIAYCFIVADTFFLLWPWLWSDPIGNLAASLSHWSSYVPREYFLGNLQVGSIAYFPAYFLVTTPALLFIPLAAGIFSAVKSRDPYRYALLAWFIMPFAYGFSSFIQGGMRYLIMIYPAVAILCVLGLAGIAGWVAGLAKSRYFFTASSRSVFIVLSVLTVIYLAVSLASVYPYYLDYYNSLAGGPMSVYESKSYNFGWWGEGISECMLYLDNNVPAGSNVTMIVRPDSPYNFDAYAGDLNYTCRNIDRLASSSPDPSQPMIISLPREDADYILINSYVEEYDHIYVDESNYTLVYASRVQNAPLARVYKANR